MLNELEDQLDLEEEALELNPVFEQGVAGVQPPRTERKQPLVCPRPSRQIVSGFPRHANTVNSLPRAEQEKIRITARLILGSFQPGCQPSLTVSLLGHADRDVQRGPAFEKRISEERAMAVRKVLQSFINNSRIVSRIRWLVIGAGAGSLIVPNARTERERARNRRVEIFLGPIPLDGLIKGVTVDTRGASIRFVGEAAPRAGEFDFDLYRDRPGPPASLLPRTEWMRRGATLGLAQRAFTNGQRVKLVVANDLVQSIEIYKA